MVNNVKKPASKFGRIAVLAGGDSAERTVSLTSGRAVCRALSQRGHHVESIDPAEIELRKVDWSRFQVAFLALHGTFGEDGGVQDLLDELGVVYTGSSAAVSRFAFSKSASKERFHQLHVPTPPYSLFHEAEGMEVIKQKAEDIGFPLVIKPDAQGSSLGVSMVRTRRELPKAISECLRYDAFGIIERAVLGSEWTLGFLNDRSLPLIRIETDRDFFDFRAKYDDDGTGYRFDNFGLSDEVLQAIEMAGRNAAVALGTAGLVRVDILLDESHRPWVLEVNTIPGLTDHSLIPKAAARLGIELGELCEKTIDYCLQPVEEYLLQPLQLRPQNSR